MKKCLCLFCLSLLVVISTMTQVLAENFYYRVYNPKTNQSDTKAELIYFKVTSTEYQIGFGSKFGACVMTNMIQPYNGQGLWKGTCSDINNGNEYKWSEITLKTLDAETRSLVHELSEKGLKPYSP